MVVAWVVALPIGIGAFTFVYANGFAYVSSDPSACVNCHIMSSLYDAWPSPRPPHTAGAGWEQVTPARPGRSSTATHGSSASSRGDAFALDYRDRRGHAFALFDLEQTR
jgi:hypothetical protein